MFLLKGTNKEQTMFPNPASTDEPNNKKMYYPHKIFINTKKYMHFILKCLFLNKA